MGVCGCGWPISTIVILYGTASHALMNISLISVSAADVITALMIFAMFNTTPLFSGMVASFDRKKCPPARLRDPGLLRYEALLLHASTMSLAWYVTTAFSCDAT